MEQTTKPQPRWKRCEDVEPPENELVLCVGVRGGYFIGFHIEAGFFKVPSGTTPVRQAVFWTELPPTPWEIPGYGAQE